MTLSLILAAFGTSVVSGMTGMAGGMLLLVIMSPFFPPAVLIPLHGAVQLASNSIRSLLLWRHLNYRIIGAFFLGGLLGAGTGSQMLVDIPEAEYRLALGCFILLLTWMPKFQLKSKVKGKFFYLGAATGFLALFAGATGPFNAPFFLREGLVKETLVGTKAACQAITHSTKLVVFGFLGFQFGPYLELLSGMILAVFLGTYVGKLLLGKISDANFKILFRAIITLLAFRLIYLGLTG